MSANCINTSIPLSFAQGGTNAVSQGAALTSILGSSFIPASNGGMGYYLVTNGTDQGTYFQYNLGTSLQNILNGTTTIPSGLMLFIDFPGAAIITTNIGTGALSLYAATDALTTDVSSTASVLSYPVISVMALSIPSVVRNLTGTNALVSGSPTKLRIYYSGTVGTSIISTIVPSTLLVKIGFAVA